MTNSSDNEIEYKFNENQLILEIAHYIDATYQEHYARNKFQATEFIIDSGHGIGFALGNVMKYAQRYGKKGSTDAWRKDLLKTIHYAIIALHVHDQEQKEVAAQYEKGMQPWGQLDPMPYMPTTLNYDATPCDVENN